MKRSPCILTLRPLALIVFATIAIHPQTQAPDSGPTFRVSVDLVQVDAVVTDAKGHHVSDLKPQDFEILEDGKPQKITHFAWVEGAQTPRPGSPKQAAGATTGPRSSLIANPSQPLERAQVHRTIVLLADDLAARSAMKNFIDREMQPGDLVSIMTTSGGMGATEELTNDKRQLYAAIDRIHYVAGRTGLTWYVPVHKPDAAAIYESESNKRLAAIRNPFLGAGTGAALAYAIQGLRDMPGRKAIALFSDGLPQSAGGIIEMANRASVTIYTLDPRGLASFYMTAVDYVRPADVDAEQAAREAVYRASQRSLEELARGTGGLFFHDQNDLDHGLAAALDDMGGYYLIGYQPEREDFNPVQGHPPFHKIEVKVLRRGLQVRSRNGFVGTPDRQASAGAKSPQEELRNALLSPFQANGFPVHLSTFYTPASHRSAVLRAMLAIDARALTFKDAPDGKKQLNLEIVAAAYGPDNRVVTSSDKLFNTDMTADQTKDIVASGLVYGFDMAVPKPGPYQLRIAARDNNSTQLGSAHEFVDVPDFSRSPLALSSITLRDPEAARNRAFAGAGVLGEGSAVTRNFAAGAKLNYDCTVSGKAATPSVEMQVLIFRGTSRIFESRRMRLAPSNTPGIHASGEIRLPSGLAAGEYALQLLVYGQKGNGAAESATQWTDFTLI